MVWDVQGMVTTAVMAGILGTQLIPPETEAKLRALATNAFRSKVCKDFTAVIPQYEWPSSNSMYDACSAYLATLISDRTYAVKVTKAHTDGPELTVAVDAGEMVTDSHGDAAFSWLRTHDSYGYRCFQLSVDKKHRDYALKVYLPYVWAKAEEIAAEEKKTVRLYTLTVNSYSSSNTDATIWTYAVVNHPATMETVAMDPAAKARLVRDLDSFVKGKDYYRRVGRAWKRGYLLYGPPGTGKSSLIAAMANYLKFDIFDLDLKAVKSNSHLRTLLLSATSRSILVIEDIDCSPVTLSRAQSKSSGDSRSITLSGLLNLIDGLWSCCGEARIIVFTTNYRERLDPALLRPGRMDVQLEMSYCNFSAFKILASNYLGIHDHPLFPEIDQLLTRSPATPAQIAGLLMETIGDVDAALNNVISLLNQH